MKLGSGSAVSAWRIRGQGSGTALAGSVLPVVAQIVEEYSFAQLDHGFKVGSGGDFECSAVLAGCDHGWAGLPNSCDLNGITGRPDSFRNDACSAVHPWPLPPIGRGNTMPLCVPYKDARALSARQSGKSPLSADSMNFLCVRATNRGILAVGSPSHRLQALPCSFRRTICRAILCPRG